MARNWLPCIMSVRKIVTNKWTPLRTYFLCLFIVINRTPINLALVHVRVFSEWKHLRVHIAPPPLNVKLTYRIGLALLCRKIREKLTSRSEKAVRSIGDHDNESGRKRYLTHAFSDVSCLPERERERESDGPVLGSFTLNQLYVTKEINLMYGPIRWMIVWCVVLQSKNRDFLVRSKWQAISW